MTSTPQPVPGPQAAPSPRQAPVPGPPGSEQAVAPVGELEELRTLAHRPLAEHVAVFDAVHRALSEQLRGAES